MHFAEHVPQSASVSRCVTKDYSKLVPHLEFRVFQAAFPASSQRSSEF
jgi:hypothetical protein